jgi:hypothetical protein
MPATAIKERPILFNAEMVRAILDGRKSQTRRVVNPQPRGGTTNMCLPPALNMPQGVYSDPAGALGRGPNVRSNAPPVRLPYGKPGDRLWVRRSAWCAMTVRIAMAPAAEIQTMHLCVWYDQPVSAHPEMRNSLRTLQCHSMASLQPHAPLGQPHHARNHRGSGERVQEISEGDAKAEGCGLGCTVKSEQFGRYMSAGQYAFAELWDSINAKPKPMRQDGAITHYVSFPWSGKSGTFKHMGKPHCVYANPWVWCIGFRKLERAG